MPTRAAATAPASATAPRATPAPGAGTSFYSRVERFASVASTNDVVRGWLEDGRPEVCLAVAGEQTAGRGRRGRDWVGPPGAALLASLGFRPTWLAPDRVWRLGAVAALAMCDAAEDAAGLPVGAIRLKWPNDLVVETSGPHALLVGETTAEAAAATLAGPPAVRKLAGILGESDGLGTESPRVVVGIGINADWAAPDFPAALAGSMTSLRETSGGRPIDLDALLEGFADRVEGRVEALRAGFFDIAGWLERQATTGRLVRLVELPNVCEHDGDSAELVRALGVDPLTGALVIEDPAAASGERAVHAGEVVNVRLARQTV